MYSKIVCCVCGEVLYENGAYTNTTEVYRVADILDTTKVGDEHRSFVALYPQFFYCEKHVRDSNTYYLKENL
jgi:hypothetical protein